MQTTSPPTPPVYLMLSCRYPLRSRIRILKVRNCVQRSVVWLLLLLIFLSHQAHWKCINGICLPIEKIKLSITVFCMVYWTRRSSAVSHQFSNMEQSCNQYHLTLQTGILPIRYWKDAASNVPLLALGIIRILTSKLVICITKVIKEWYNNWNRDVSTLPHWKRSTTGFGWTSSCQEWTPHS